MDPRGEGSGKKKKTKKGNGKKKAKDLTKLDLADISKQEAAFQRQEDVADRFYMFMDMMGNRDYVKGYGILMKNNNLL